MDYYFRLNYNKFQFLATMSLIKDDYIHCTQQFNTNIDLQRVTCQLTNIMPKRKFQTFHWTNCMNKIQEMLFFSAPMPQVLATEDWETKYAILHLCMQFSKTFMSRIIYRNSHIKCYEIYSSWTNTDIVALVSSSILQMKRIWMA